jgi:hypothetical protein
MKRQRAIIEQERPLVNDPYDYDQQQQVFEHCAACEIAQDAIGITYQCVFEEVKEARRKLLQLSRRSLLTLTF